MYTFLYTIVLSTQLRKSLKVVTKVFFFLLGHRKKAGFFPASFTGKKKKKGNFNFQNIVIRPKTRPNKSVFIMLLSKLEGLFRHFSLLKYHSYN